MTLAGWGLPTPNQLGELKLNYDTHSEIVNTIDRATSFSGVPPRRQSHSIESGRQSFSEEFYRPIMIFGNADAHEFECKPSRRAWIGRSKSVWERSDLRSQRHVVIFLHFNLKWSGTIYHSKCVTQRRFRGFSSRDLNGFQFEGIVVANWDGCCSLLLEWDKIIQLWCRLFSDGLLSTNGTQNMYIFQLSRYTLT